MASFTPDSVGLSKPTVVRTRGEVAIRPTTAATSDTSIVGAYGLAIVTDLALAAGVASILGPWSDPGWDGWFVWRSIHFTQENASTTGVYNNMHTQEVDSKAMRKVSDGESLVLVAESQATSFRILMPLRLLLKLS